MRSLFFGLTAQQQTTITFPIFFLTKIVQDKFSRAIVTGLLIGRGRKSQISQDFQGQIRRKIGRFRGSFRGKLHQKAIGKKRSGARSSSLDDDFQISLTVLRLFCYCHLVSFIYFIEKSQNQGSQFSTIANVTRHRQSCQKEKHV